MIELRLIEAHEQQAFRQMAEAYWQELMPHADVLRDAASCDRYFGESFQWAGEIERLYWAVRGQERMGFLAYSLIGQAAYINDFYVIPAARRAGIGRQMAEALNQRFDQFGITLVELNVQRDNPRALQFWEACGFRIASYRLRQYRDPSTGERFIGRLSSDFAANLPTGTSQ
jgi:ribosomal protein S18 acetylase RimI-like enzyme